MIRTQFSLFSRSQHTMSGAKHYGEVLIDRRTKKKNLLLVSLFACILMAPATNPQLNEMSCKENLLCNRTGNAWCCLVTANAVIKNDNIRFDAIKEWIEGEDRMEKMIFEPNQNVFFLPNYVGNRFPNLTIYIARNCAILDITFENFERLRKLKTLDLTSNEITALQKSAFIELISLENIFLGENFIRFLDVGVFCESPNLIIVDLTANLCINGVFSKQQLNKAMKSKCQRRARIIIANSFYLSCKVNFSLKLFKSVAPMGTVYSGSIQGGVVESRFFLAALYYDTPQSTSKYFCAASLISYDHLITAAHCIQPKNQKEKLEAANMFAVVGLEYLTEQLDDIERTCDISEITIHPNWSTTEIKYSADIAILTTNFTYLAMYSRIELVLITKSNEINKVENGIVAGWGDRQAGAPYDGAMRTVALKALSLEDCIMNDHKFAKLSPRNTFCAGGEGRAPCTGASGGGFYVKMNGIWFLRGIVSSGPRKMDGSCNVNRYNLYTRVSDYVDWILEVVGPMDAGSIPEPDREVTC